jgi:hypothetical protein
MAANKNSLAADAVANLYRAALFLARSKREEKLAVSFIKKARDELRGEYPELSKRVDRLLKASFSFSNDEGRLIQAEKVLDEFIYLRRSILL